MRFRDLLDVPFDGSTGRIDTVELKARLPHIPDQIVDEWLAPHGRNSDMQRQYAEMDLEAVAWSLTRREAHEILEASVFPGFRKYLNDVAKRASDVSSGKWNAADSRPQVVFKMARRANMAPGTNLRYWRTCWICKSAPPCRGPHAMWPALWPRGRGRNRTKFNAFDLDRRKQ